MVPGTDLVLSAALFATAETIGNIWSQIKVYLDSMCTAVLIG